MNSKGIFFTFMAFLLIGTLMVLSSSLSQTSAKMERNLVTETALEEIENSFDNLRQQISVTKQGAAGNVYSRHMPFKGFELGDNWFELEQSLPIEGEYLKDTYNALNIFSVFAQAAGSKGTQVEVDQVVKNSDWSSNPGTDEFPEIGYIVKPQCMLLKVIKDNDTAISIDDKVVFEAGSIAANDCEQDFSLESIEGFDINIHIPTIYYEFLCTGAFDCTSRIPEAPYVKILVEWDNCEDPSGSHCDYLDYLDGSKEVVVNLGTDFISSGGDSVWIIHQSDVGGGVGVEINPGSIGQDFEALQVLIYSTEFPTPPSSPYFDAKVIFKDRIEEIALSEGMFDFSVGKKGFEICKGTSEGTCAEGAND